MPGLGGGANEDVAAVSTRRVARVGEELESRRAAVLARMVAIGVMDVCAGVQQWGGFAHGPGRRCVVEMEKVELSQN